MLTRDVLAIASRSFKNNRLRTFLTVLGISLGIGTVFSLVSLGYGLQKLILSRIATEESLMALDVVGEEKKLTKESISEIESINMAAKAYPVIIQETEVAVGGITSRVQAVFVHSAFFKLDNVKKKEGNFFNEEESNYAVATEGVLSLLNIDDFKNATMTVDVINDNKSKETFKKDYSIKGLADNEEEAIVYLPISSISNLGLSEYGKIKVRLDSKEAVGAAREEISAKGYFVEAVSELVEQVNQIFNVAKVILFLFGVVALTISAIGMFNTMTIALLERTKEIAVMKSLGASSFDIWRLFLTEAAAIGFVGGILGISAGAIFSFLFNLGINMLAVRMGGEAVDLFYTPIWMVIFIIIFSSLIGLITGIYPARRAARLNPLDALKYK